MDILSYSSVHFIGNVATPVTIVSPVSPMEVLGGVDCTEVIIYGWIGGC